MVLQEEGCTDYHRLLMHTGRKDGLTSQALVSGGAEGVLIIWRINLSAAEKPWSIVARLKVRF